MEDLSRRVASVPDDASTFFVQTQASDGSGVCMEYVQKLQDTVFGESRLIREIHYADSSVDESRLSYVLQASPIPGIEQRVGWMMSNIEHNMKL